MLDLVYRRRVCWSRDVPVRQRQLGVVDPYLHQTAAVEVLHDVCRILAGQGVVHYVCDGTLLGIIRNSGFIPNDNDLDLRVARNALTEGLIATFAKAGYVAFKRCHSEGWLASVGLFRDGIAVDLYGADIQGASERFDIVRMHGYLSYHLPYCGVQRFEFRGCAISVPKNVQAHLKACYGPHWQIPVTQWDHLHSHQALFCATGGLKFLSASARRYLAAQKYVFPERDGGRGAAQSSQLYRMYGRALRMHRDAARG